MSLDDTAAANGVAPAPEEDSPATIEGVDLGRILISAQFQN